MKKSVLPTALSNLHSHRGPWFSNMVLASTVGITALTLTACASVPDTTKQRVAHSQTVVDQAHQTIGTSESGAIELQQARDKLALAKAALEDERPKDAERAAYQAQLDAELAMAKSESSAARRSADEVLASLETLRQEAERNSPTVR